MAYPYVAAAYGFKPVNLVGGREFAASTRMYPIQSGYATSIYNGDIVALSSTSTSLGTLVSTSMTNATVAGVAGTLGIFLGAEYSLTGGPIYGKNRYQFWNASTAAQDAVGYVYDDPQAVFRAAVIAQPNGAAANTSTTIGYVNPYYVGSNFYAVTGGGGSTQTGDSGMGVCGTAPTTAGTGTGARLTTSAPFRVVGVVPDTQLSFTAVASTSGSSTTVTTVNAANTYGPTLPGTTAALGIIPGMQLISTASTSTGANVSNYITVVSVTGSTLTVNSAITLAANTTITLVGYPEVLVTWNFGYNAYFNATGA
jgi:hypothetical protein